MAYQFEQLEETGRLENFARAAGEADGEFDGIYFNDSDVYKWVEAASYVLANGRDRELEAALDEVIESIVGAQEESGYLNTYFTLVEPEKKWTNLGMMHELYCAGHLFEAAVARYRGSDDERLLEVSCRLADHIDDVFGPEGLEGYPGHEEIELALVKLSEVTGERRYLELARYFVDARGDSESRFEWELEQIEELAGAQLEDRYRELFEDDEGDYDGAYAQDDGPVREAEAVVGHAVRAMYLYTAMSDVARETGDEELLAAQDRLWESLTNRRLYVTGGIGPSHDNEGFTDDFDLPNHDAYAETCAAVGVMLWSHRLLRATGESRFGDVFERTLYNGFLSGVSLSGTEFFYVNPLASEGDHHRRGWFDCACCPPNVARFLASLERYVYLTTEETLFVNLFVGGEVTTSIGDRQVTLRQETEYPWDGEISLEVCAVESGDTRTCDDEFTIAVRIPGWCTDAMVRVDGDVVELEEVLEDGFAHLERAWSPGQVIDVELPMPVVCLEAHPEVSQAAGRVALQRGPVVYCFEAVDNDVSLGHVSIPEDASVESRFDPGLLGGTVVVETEAVVPALGDWSDRLYQPRGSASTERTTVTAIPYHLWDHRESGEMRVWVRSE